MNNPCRIEHDRASVRASERLPTAPESSAEPRPQADRPKRWPLLVIGFGLVLTALWGALLGWVVIEALGDMLF